MTQDRWKELCKLVERNDGLPVREVGSWTEDKLWFWSRYIEITTRAMVGNPKWRAGLAYVDLFAGPGVCEIEGSKRRIPGSVLIAAHAPKPFEIILAAEMKSSLAEALRKRMVTTPAASRFEVFQGDCNVVIDQLITKIPPRALTLAFIDPEALHIKFNTVRKLAGRGQVDLLVLFADRMDIVRNVDRYEKQHDSKLDQMLGHDSNWREGWASLSNRTPLNVCRFFADLYEQQLRSQLGYVTFGEKEMSTERGPIYRLIYASKHAKGLEFWNKISKRDPDGQLGFGFQLT